MDADKIQEICERAWRPHIFTTEQLIQINKAKWLAAVQYLGKKWVVTQNVGRVL